MWNKLRKQLTALGKGERGVRLVVLLGIAGLACILLSGFLPDGNSESEQTETSSQAESESTQAYCSRLETQLTEILEQIAGVGQCQVMVNASGTSETVYVQDEETEQEDSRSQSQKKCVIVSDGSTQQALVQQVVAPEISGVIIVCDGASSSVVQERVCNAVQAVLDLPTNRICVMPGA